MGTQEKWFPKSLKADLIFSSPYQTSNQGEPFQILPSVSLSHKHRRTKGRESDLEIRVSVSYVNFGIYLKKRSESNKNI